MVVLSIHLSLSLLLISAQFFVEPPSQAPPVQWRKVYIYIYSVFYPQNYVIVYSENWLPIQITKFFWVGVL